MLAYCPYSSYSIDALKGRYFYIYNNVSFDWHFALDQVVLTDQ